MIRRVKQDRRVHLPVVVEPIKTLITRLNAMPSPSVRSTRTDRMVEQIAEWKRERRRFAYKVTIDRQQRSNEDSLRATRTNHSPADGVEALY